MNSWAEWWLFLVGGMTVQAVVIFGLSYWAFKRGMFDRNVGPELALNNVAEPEVAEPERELSSSLAFRESLMDSEFSALAPVGMPSFDLDDKLFADLPLQVIGSATDLSVATADAIVKMSQEWTSMIVAQEAASTHFFRAASMHFHNAPIDAFRAALNSIQSYVQTQATVNLLAKGLYSGHSTTSGLLSMVSLYNAGSSELLSPHIWVGDSTPSMQTAQTIVVAKLKQLSEA